MVQWLGLGPLAAGVGFQPWELRSCTLHNRGKKKKKKIVVSSSRVIVSLYVMCFFVSGHFQDFLFIFGFGSLLMIYSSVCFFKKLYFRLTEPLESINVCLLPNLEHF